MKYIPRVPIAGAYYHVGTRGNNKRSIFDDDRDREVFLLILLRIARRHGWLVFAYCLMGNHYHLVLQTGESGISRGMCELNTAHAVTYNVRHGRTNHLFGRRFWSELIDTNEYLLGACRYVLQNPVRAGLCDTCEGWQWSSYRATVGKASRPPFLATDDLIDFVAPRGSERVARFEEYCEMIVPRRAGR